MRDRLLKLLGLTAVVVVTSCAILGAQAPQTAPAAGAGRQGAAQSPTFARIQARTYEFKEGAVTATLPYEVYVPTKYDKSKPTPLIVALHGLGSNPTGIIRYGALTELAEERGYIVVAPMGFNTGGWYGSQGPGKPRVGRGQGDQSGIPDNLGEVSEKDVMNVFEMVRKEFNIDRSRTYLFGHSMGGGGTWYLGMKYKDNWAALAMAAPAIYSSPDLAEQIKDMPVFIMHGDADTTVRVDSSRAIVEKMKSLNMKYQYVEVPGGTHTDIIVNNPANMRKVFDFFDAQKKK
jgi:predicted peptidase